MDSIKNSVQITITGSNPFETKSKATALNKLSKLDTDALSKLVELSQSPKAIESLKTNFAMIKGFLA